MSAEIEDVVVDAARVLWGTPKIGVTLGYYPAGVHGPEGWYEGVEVYAPPDDRRGVWVSATTDSRVTLARLGIALRPYLRDAFRAAPTNTAAAVINAALVRLEEVLVMRFMWLLNATRHGSVRG